jgi:hypothetical protein
LRDFYCGVEVFGFDDVVSGNGLHAPKQIFSTAL